MTAGLFRNDSFGNFLCASGNGSGLACPTGRTTSWPGRSKSLQKMEQDPRGCSKRKDQEDWTPEAHAFTESKKKRTSILLFFVILFLDTERMHPDPGEESSGTIQTGGTSGNLIYCRYRLLRRVFQVSQTGSPASHSKHWLALLE